MLIAIAISVAGVIALILVAVLHRRRAQENDLNSTDYRRVARAALSRSDRIREAALLKIRNAPLPESADSLADVFMRVDSDYDFYPAYRREEKKRLRAVVFEALTEYEGPEGVDALLPRLEHVVFDYSFRETANLLNEKILKRAGSAEPWRRLLLLRLTHHVHGYLERNFGAERRKASDLAERVSGVILDEDDLQALLRLLKDRVEVSSYGHYGIPSYDRDHDAEPVGMRTSVNYDKAVKFLEQSAADTTRLRELIEAERKASP